MRYDQQPQLQLQGPSNNMEDHEDGLDDGGKDSGKSRKSRNLSEKKRRDQFNMLINELHSVVATNNRKMDKTTILKTTIAFLKHNNEVTQQSHVNEIKEDWKPSFLSNDEFTQLMLESLESCVMVFTQSGTILYTSESVTQLLRYLPNDLENRSLYDIVHPDDRVKVKKLLSGQTFVPGNGGTPDFSKVENQISFTCHLKRGSLLPKDSAIFERVNFNGNLRKWSLGIFLTADEDEEASTFLGGAMPTEEICYCCTVKIQTNQLIRELAVADECKKEFTSRHSMEWKFLFLDHRGPSIIGYLPYEVLGTSGYDYYHPEDLEAVVKCHEQLMLSGKGTSCYYRFLSKGHQWIWLQTRYYITYHQWNSKPEFVVCTNTVVSFVDVRAAMRENLEMKDTEEEEVEQDNQAPGTTYDEGPADTSGHSVTCVDHPQIPANQMVSDQDLPGASSDHSLLRHTDTSGSIVSSSNGLIWGPSLKSATTTAYTGTWSGYVGEATDEAQPTPGPSSDHGGMTNENSSTSTQPQTSSAIIIMPQQGIVQATGIPISVQQPQHPQQQQQTSLYLTAAQQQFKRQLQQKHAQLQESILRQQQELQEIWGQLMLTSRLSFPILQQHQQQQPEQQPQSPLASELPQSPLNPGVVIQCMSSPVASQQNVHIPDSPLAPLPLFPQQQHSVLTNPVLSGLVSASVHTMPNCSSPALAVISPSPLTQSNTLELTMGSPAGIYTPLITEGQQQQFQQQQQQIVGNYGDGHLVNLNTIVMSPASQMSAAVQSPLANPSHTECSSQQPQNQAPREHS